MAYTDQKANGVYYTPEPVVRYIVERTIVPFLEDGQHAWTDVRVLDPACGNGAFLTIAYRTLLEYAEQRRAPDVSSQRLAEESLQQVCGVDVDAAALQAARDSLARMSCRVPLTSGSETVECIDPQRIALLADRLATTLRCGDALLDADSMPDSTSPVTPPVAWNRAFPAVFQRQNPGFDVVLGNPPYVNIRVLTRSRGPAVKRYFQQRYRSASGSYDLYVLFMERALQLLREGGRCGMIVPNKIAALDYARNCRTLLLEQTSLLEIVDAAGLDLFRGAAVYPYILIWEKKRAVTSASRVADSYRLRWPAAKSDTPIVGSAERDSRRKPAFGSMRLWHSKRAFLACPSGSTPSCIAGQPGLSPMNSGDGLSKQRHPRATPGRV